MLKGNFKRKARAVSQHGEGCSHSSPWAADTESCADNPSQASTQRLQHPLRAEGVWGAGGYPLGASQNFPHFQARKRLWKMCWKQQLGTYEETRVSGQVLQLNWGSKRENRDAGNTQRTLQKGERPHNASHSSSLIPRLYQPRWLPPAPNLGLSRAFFRTAIFILKTIHSWKLQLYILHCHYFDLLNSSSLTMLLLKRVLLHLHSASLAQQTHAFTDALFITLVCICTFLRRSLGRHFVSAPNGLASRCSE